MSRDEQVARIHRLQYENVSSGLVHEIVGETEESPLYSVTEYYRNTCVAEWTEDADAFLVTRCRTRRCERWKRTKKPWMCVPCDTRQRSQRKVAELKIDQHPTYIKRIKEFVKHVRGLEDNHGIRKSRGCDAIDLTLYRISGAQRDSKEVKRIRALALEFNLRLDDPMRVPKDDSYSRYRMIVADANPFAREFFKEFS
jgi:hypothetical protein